jgi:hypothetical protein
MAPLFTNALGRFDGELAALTVLPPAWEEVLLAKNLAAGLLTLVAGSAATISVWTFCVDPPDGSALAHCALFWMALLFPMLIAGNLWSVLEHRTPGGALETLADGGAFLITAGVLAIPYGLFVSAAAMPILCLPYTACCAAIWRWWSIPHAAGLLRTRIASMQERT